MIEINLADTQLCQVKKKLFFSSRLAELLESKYEKKKLKKYVQYRSIKTGAYFSGPMSSLILRSSMIVSQKTFIRRKPAQCFKSFLIE